MTFLTRFTGALRKQNRHLEIRSRYFINHIALIILDHQINIFALKRSLYFTQESRVALFNMGDHQGGPAAA